MSVTSDLISVMRIIIYQNILIARLRVFAADVYDARPFALNYTLHQKLSWHSLTSPSPNPPFANIDIIVFRA